MGQDKYSKDDGGGNVFVLLCILVLIVGIVAAAGMVMAVLNYNREGDAPVNINVGRDDYGGYGGNEGYTDNSRGGSSDGGYSMEKSRSLPRSELHYDESVWSFQLADTDNRVLYIDRKTRQHRGHFVDVLNEVCTIAGKNCETLHFDYRECWDNNFPQQGLLGKWADGCVGYAQSVERIRSFKFTSQLIKAPKPVMLTRRGNPRGVTADNLSGLKIGILTGWWADMFCIFSSTGYDIRNDQVIAYVLDDDLNSIVGGLDRGEVDAIFISNELGRATDGSLELIEEFEPCLLGGDSVMMRKDSLLKYWWDPAFNKLVNSREYREMCHDIDDPAVHGVKAGASAADTCVNL